MDVLKELEGKVGNTIRVMKLPEYDSEKVTIPTKGSVEAAGFDLYSVEDAIVYPQDNEMIHTGIAIAIPSGYVGFVFARSGMAHKQHLRPSNAVGVIDSDYRGEVLVSLYNDDPSEEMRINAGQRIAQLVITPYLNLSLEEVNHLSDTERGAGGFGSTGT